MQIAQYRTKIRPTLTHQLSPNHQSFIKIYQTYANHNKIDITPQRNSVTKNPAIRINSNSKDIDFRGSIEKESIGIGIGGMKSSLKEDDFLYKIDMNLLRQTNVGIDQQSQKTAKRQRAYFTGRNQGKEIK